MKLVSQLDKDGMFTGAAVADESPLEPGVHLIPAGAVDLAPPQIPDGQIAQLVNGAWVFSARPVPAAIEQPPAPTIAQIKAFAIAAVRRSRPAVFSVLAGLQSEALANANAALAAAIVPLQQALRDLPATDLSACTTQAQVDATFVAAWLAIAAAAPPSVASAFNEVLSQ